MRVLLVTQYFYPENFKSNDIAFELAKRGYKVDVLTGIPNYPEGKFYKGYGVFRKRCEVVDGVHIKRVYNIPRGKRSSKIALIFNYLSFAINASFRALIIAAFTKKYDAIIVHQPSPIFQAIPAIVLGKLTKTKVYTWVLDVWPEAFVSGSGVKNGIVLSILNSVTRWVYKGSTKILISSKRFIDSVNKKGDFSNKTIYFPNWSEDMVLKGAPCELPKLPVGFIIMVAGNIGVSQNLDNIAKAAKELRDLPDVKWVFIGDGSRRPWLEEFIKENNLESTVFCLGRYPYSMMPSFYSCADTMLVSLNEDFEDLKMVVPARLQSYMSAGKPVLAMIGIGGRELVEEADCGYAVGGDDYRGLAELIRNKVLPYKEDFAQKGMKGRDFFLEFFTKEKCISNLETIIKNS